MYKAVKRGYAVVAMGAHRGGDKWRCYDTQWPPEEHHEISGVSEYAGRPPSAEACAQYTLPCRDAMRTFSMHHHTSVSMVCVQTSWAKNCAHMCDSRQQCTTLLKKARICRQHTLTP